MVNTPMDVIGVRGSVRAAGVDLCDADRLRLAVERTGPALARRVFTAEERSACADGADPTATAILFGIKESVIKLIGGLPAGTGFRDIRIGVGCDLNGPTGLNGPTALNGPNGPAGPAGLNGRMPVRLCGGLADLAGPDPVDIVAAGAPLGARRIALCWAIAAEPTIHEPAVQKKEAGC
jgi:hypothetical protein